MRVTKEINTSLIKIDRIPLDSKSLKYANLLKQGTVFPPIKVALKANGSFEIRDGRHRWLASKLLGRDKILAKFSTKCLHDKNREYLKDIHLVSNYED